MKFMKKLTVGLTLGALTMSPIFINMYSLSSVQATDRVSNPRRELSLGASLTEEEIVQTKSLLGAVNQPVDNTVKVDGLVIDKYLHIGSDLSTGVFSSGVIETLPEGSGVQVQIVTPHNIQYVKPVTYQNAAITSGAKDVLIKIASVKPVTGEGALAGIYALFEKSGMKVDQKAVQVAEKEIQLVEQAKKDTEVTDAQVNKIIMDIKTEITNDMVNNQEINIEQTVQTVINNNETIQLSPETIKFLEQVAKEYTQTEAAKNKDTSEQLKNSIQLDSEKPYAVDLDQFGGIAAFKREGEVSPNLIQVTSKDDFVFFDENEAAYKAEFENVDTKEVTVVAEDGSTRKVKVNTVIHLLDQEGNPLENEEDDLYLFINMEGQLSLLTPNYKENDDSEAMLEYHLTENPTEDTIEDPDPEKYPYMVDLDDLGSEATFTLEEANVPSQLILNVDRWDLVYSYPDAESEKSFVDISNVPTQEITVFSADGSGKRDIKVNTVVRAYQDTETLFLFVNREGGISLATPNYDENVEEEDKDVMLEYPLTDIQEKSENTDENEDDSTSETSATESSEVEDTSEAETTILGEDTSEAETTILGEDTSEAETTILDEDTSEAETTILGEDASEAETTILGEDTSEADTTILDEETSELETTPSEDQNQEPTMDSSEFPYMVDISNITEETSFYSKGMNIPNNILLDFDLETVKLEFSKDLVKEGEVNVENIPTKEIRIASHDNNEIRNVKVNTEIHVTDIDGEEDQYLYLFINNDGQLALATPNYAGNYEPEDKDVMLEYIIGNYDTETGQISQP